MNSHHVYRTQKGTLTLVQQATDPIFLIKASTPQKAKEMLQVLRDFEKQEAKKIDQIKL